MQIVVVVSQFRTPAFLGWGGACAAISSMQDRPWHACERQTGKLLLLLPQVSDAEEDDDARDVIDRGVLLLPAFNRFLNNGLSRLLSRVVLVVGHDNIGSLLI